MPVSTEGAAALLSFRYPSSYKLAGNPISGVAVEIP